MASALSEGDRDAAAAGARTERLGEGAPFRLHLVAHDPEVFGRFYGVVANPVLWFVQHGLWDLKHDPDADLGEAWARATSRRTGPWPSPPSPSSTGGRRHLSSSTTTTSTSCLPSYGKRDRGAHRPLRPHPVGRSDRVVGAARRDRPRRPRGPPGLRQRRFPHRALAGRLRRELRGPPRARRRGGGALARQPDRGGRGRARGPRSEPGRPGAAPRLARGPSRAPRAARRPHRPVEERRSRLRRLRAVARARAGAPGSDPAGRPARSLAAGDSRVRGVQARHRGAPRRP